MNKSTVLLTVSLILTTPGCSTILSNLPGVYTLDIQQGNMIEQAMIDQLRPNMTKRQVLYIMGSPMVSDSFHERRWDYLFAEQKGGEERVQKRISLFFNGDNLMGVQGDFHPSRVPVLKTSNEATIELPKRELDRSMWEKISSLFSTDLDPEEQKLINEPAKPEDKSSGFFNF